MKHLENYQSLNKFKPKLKTFWFISGDIEKVTNTLIDLKDNYLNEIESSDIKKIVSVMYEYKNVESIGIFVYYGRLGFSFSILEDTSNMIDLYRAHKDVNIYTYLGEMIIKNNRVSIDIKNKKFLEDIVKYNL